MDNTKKKKLGTIYRVLLLLYLSIFPFGQLLKINIFWGGRQIPIHPIDLIAGLSISVLIIGYDFSKFNKILFPVFASGIFSLLVSFNVLPSEQIFIGTMYLFRLFSYYSLFLVTLFVIDTTGLDKKIFKILNIVILTVALFGWLQYLFIPDLRLLKYLGWDDHRDRLAGSFLDPGFIGILLVFGFIQFFDKYFKSKKLSSLVLSLFFGITTLLTYSRASILALVVSAWYFIFKNKLKLKHHIAVLVVVVFGIILLPRPSSGEGVRLERIYSVNARFINYAETLQIFGDSPLFGIGYNNICWHRQKINPKINPLSHSCFGSDSSILLYLTTLGVVGVLILIGSWKRFVIVLNKGDYHGVLVASAIAVFIHSNFNNSLFYPWVMGYLAIVLALNVSSRE